MPLNSDSIVLAPAALVEELVAEGAVVVITSNRRPDEMTNHGGDLQRPPNSLHTEFSPSTPDAPDA